MASLRNTPFVVAEATEQISSAVERGLMHVTLAQRDSKRVVLPDGREVVEFINCSYLGMDTHPLVISGGKRVLDQWGVHLCCARSRFSIGPLGELEAGLSQLFGGRAITFPSVSAAHNSVLPLLASGVLFEESDRPVRLIFDRFAHASMQFLRPILAAEARVVTIEHNDLNALWRETTEARAQGESPVYIADGVYSMSGFCPVDELLSGSRELGLFLYLDDAHGTSIYGDRGQGWVLGRLPGEMPDNLMVNFSLAKGFGTNGGGVVVATQKQEQLIRRFGHSYAFSGPLDFAMTGAALASLELHLNGYVQQQQQILRQKVALFDRLVGKAGATFGPLRMVLLGSPQRAVELGERLVERGFYVSVAMFPVVPKATTQLRIALTSAHSDEDIQGLCAAIAELLTEEERDQQAIRSAA